MTATAAPQRGPYRVDLPLRLSSAAQSEAVPSVAAIAEDPLSSVESLPPPAPNEGELGRV